MPYYTRKVIEGETKVPNTVQLVMIDAIGSTLETRHAFLKLRSAVQLMTWLTLWDLNTNDFIILDTFEWGSRNAYEDKTLYYNIEVPRRILKCRIPNCVFFPKSANDHVMSIFKYDEKIVKQSPIIKQLTNWHTAISDLNIKRHLNETEKE